MGDYKTSTCVSVTLPAEVLIGVLTILTSKIIEFHFAWESIVVSDASGELFEETTIPIDDVSTYAFNNHPVTGKVTSDYYLITNGQKLREVIDEGSTVTLYAMVGKSQSELVVLTKPSNGNDYYHRLVCSIWSIPTVTQGCSVQ